MKYSYLFLTLVTVILISCTSKETDPLHGYSTGYVRSMWSVCYFSHINAQPQINRHTFIPICDCVMDGTREDFSKSELDNMPEGELAPYFEKKTTECIEEARKNQEALQPSKML